MNEVDISGGFAQQRRELDEAFLQALQSVIQAAKACGAFEVAMGCDPSSADARAARTQSQERIADAHGVHPDAVGPVWIALQNAGLFAETNKADS